MEPHFWSKRNSEQKCCLNKVFNLALVSIHICKQGPGWAQTQRKQDLQQLTVFLSQDNTPRDIIWPLQSRAMFGNEVIAGAEVLHLAAKGAQCGLNLRVPWCSALTSGGRGHGTLISWVVYGREGESECLVQVKCIKVKVKVCIVISTQANHRIYLSTVRRSLYFVTLNHCVWTISTLRII